jgi:peptide/nickel transport system substrate-binding protein
MSILSNRICDFFFLTYNSLFCIFDSLQNEFLSTFHIVTGKGGISMKRWLIVFTVALSMVIQLSPWSGPGTPHAASPTASTTTGAQPQTGGTWKVIIKSTTVRFGYPPAIAGADKDYAPPFFDFLLSIGDDGKYKPELAQSWDTSADGKSITFKLRQGVKFHDGSDFNAQAVKSNLDNLIPPQSKLISGITSVVVIDDYTVKINLSAYNNLILYQLAVNPVCYMYSPTALQKNGKDWARTNPVGTGPFMLKEHQPNISLTLVKNPNYWQKGLPYLDGIKISQVMDSVTQIMTFKAGQADAIYDVTQSGAAQLRDAGYTFLVAPGNLNTMTFDTANSKYFSNPKVREAMEYAIDKEAICSGPGQGFYVPVYQTVTSASPDYNPTCPPRKYDPEKAKKLLTEAGYPNGFSFRFFFPDTTWKDGIVAIQSNLDQVGIKMEINIMNRAQFSTIQTEGKLEKGAASWATFYVYSNTLATLDAYCRSNVQYFQHMIRPAGIDALIDQAKSTRDPAAVTKINQQIVKLLYDETTFLPLWQNLRIVVVDKSVQNPGWFIGGDTNNNQFGTRTWLKK